MTSHRIAAVRIILIALVSAAFESACSSTPPVADEDAVSPSDALTHATAMLDGSNRGEPTESVPQVTHEDLSRPDAAMIGTWVRLSGTFHSSWRRVTSDAGPINGFVWDALLIDEGGLVTYVVGSEAPPEFVTSRSQVVVTGQFAGMHNYVASNGSTVAAPVIANSHWELVTQAR